MISEVRADMVASVIDVSVAVGNSVVEGDTMVMLESMKMEIPVLAEVDGTVTRVSVAEGDVVQRDDLIIIIDDHRE